ncbi:right-handed parallel beta-helix repeat-containing protein [candidate division KSB1 bacterium]|nr:right-handed parallel beta-helix repeat-containing protein [candidate division KSB1 bacterium]
MKIRIAWLILLMAIPAVVLPAADLIVAPNGDDRNPGTLERPLATLTAARNEVRDLLTSGTAFDTVTVALREGVYRITETVVLDERDSAPTGRRIVYRSFPGETARLLGGSLIPVTAVEACRDTAVLERIIDAAARQHIRVIDLKALGITRYGEHRKFGHALPVVAAPLELFIDGEVMPLARYPNEGAMLIGPIVDTGSVPRIGDYENIRGGIFEYTDDRHELWNKAEEVWFRGTFKWGYADDKIRVDWIDPVKRQVKLSTPHMYGLGSGEPFQQYIALNLLEELDRPGEWYLDRKSGRLYLYPPNDLSNSEIIVSELEEPILALENASNVTIRGVQFEATRGMGIYLEGGENNLIAGCRVRNIGTVGIQMGQGARQTFPHITHEHYEGEPVSRQTGSLKSHLYKHTTWDRRAGKKHGILSCDIKGTGSGGIVLSGGSKADLEPGECYVENCRISDYQRRNRSQWVGISVDGCGNRVSHCDISNGDLQAILVNGPLHVFEYNHLHHVGQNANDASAWYMGRDPSDQGTIIRYNFIHHVGRHDRKWMMGVYFDDGTCGALVEGNIFYDAGTYGSVYSNGGQDIIVRNNIFVNSEGPALHQKSMWWDFAVRQWDTYFGDSGIYHRRLLEVIDIRRDPYVSRFPHLANWMDLTADGESYVGMYPARNILEKNVFFQLEEPLRLTGMHAQFDCRNNFIALEDPGFVDLEALDFRLREDSVIPQKIPGFLPIPVEKIGLYSDTYWREID